MPDVLSLDERTRTELEAAAFRTLVAHFRAHPEVQNIDLMNLAGFCRNCLSKWYRAAAEERGLELSYEQAREIVYGMLVQKPFAALLEELIALVRPEAERLGYEEIARFASIGFHYDG